jgi:hypothetical protein
MGALEEPVPGMLPLRLKKRIRFLIEMMGCYLHLLERQLGRSRVRAHPWLMRCRIKSQLFNRFADFAFHGFLLS